MSHPAQTPDPAGRHLRATSAGTGTARADILPATPVDPQTPSEEMAYRRVVGRRVRAQRLWLDLNQDQVAQAAGPAVTRNFISAIERGAVGLDAWRLGLLADALDATVGWLLDRDEHSITVPAPRPTRPIHATRDAGHPASGPSTDAAPRQRP